MDLWFAAVLGIVQGLTEFIPISSTAHLRLVPAFLGQPDPGAAYSAVIQLGTLIAVMVFFARDLFVTMPRALLYDRHSPEGRLPVYLVLGTLPIAILGLTFKDFITGDARSLYIVSGSLVLVGVLMWLADRFGHQVRGLASITLTDAGIIGLAQACALVPGVSRSGSTIAMALVLGLRRGDAARFSFLLGVPAIAGAGLFELPDAMRQLGEDAWMSVAVGTLAAAISGYLSIAWLLRFLGKNSLAPFAMYRIVLGILIAGLCIAGILAPGSSP